jgi:hypothetical protein
MQSRLSRLSVELIIAKCVFYLWNLLLQNVSFMLINQYLEFKNSNLMIPILLDRYLEYLSNATSLDASRVLFLAWLFLQNTTRSDFSEF